MFDAGLRQWKDRILDPLARLLRWASPRGLTLSGLGLGVAAALLAWGGFTGLALGAWLLNRLVDGLDGQVARARGLQSDAGGYLDLMVDLVVYTLVPLGLALGLGPEDGRVWIILALWLGACYLNVGNWMFLSAILEKRERRAPGTLTTVTMPQGLVEGFETLVLYSLLLALPAWYPWILGTGAALVLLTFLQRLAWGLHYLSQP